MTNHSDGSDHDRQCGGTDENSSQDYEVGYRRPPVHSRFQPGNKAAARGGKPRKKAPKTLEQLLKRSLNKKVFVKTSDGGRIRMTNAEVMVTNLVRQACSSKAAEAVKAFELINHLIPASIEELRNSSLRVEFF